MPRREYLYEMQFWEIQAAVAGYQRRPREQWQMARLIAYSAAHCMGGKNIPPLSQWLQFPWEKGESTGNQPSREEVEMLRQMIIEENEKLKQNGKS